MDFNFNSIEVKLISCTDVKAFNYFRSLSIYVAASILKDKDDLQQQQQQLIDFQRTPIQKYGDEWNHTFHFNLQHGNVNNNNCCNLDLLLKFKLRIEGVLFGHKSIGEVCVPLNDLIRDFSGVVRFVSYQIRGTDGKPNGVLNFSYNLNSERKVKAVIKFNSDKSNSEFQFPRDGNKVENYPISDVEEQLREMGCSAASSASLMAATTFTVSGMHYRRSFQPTNTMMKMMPYEYGATGGCNLKNQTT